VFLFKFEASLANLCAYVPGIRDITVITKLLETSVETRSSKIMRGSWMDCSSCTLRVERFVYSTSTSKAEKYVHIAKTASDTTLP
jgi:hypothetical protein